MAKLPLVLSPLMVLYFILMSGCTAPAPTPAPNPQVTPSLSVSPPTPAPPTPSPRNLLTFTDPLNDSRLLPEGVACLPDYLDITRAAIARMNNGGLQVSFDLATTLPPNVEPGNHGFDFSLYLGDDIVRPAAQFRVLAAGTNYTALYTSADIPLQRVPTFSIVINGSQLVMYIQPELLDSLPATVTASLKTFFCPPASQFCCDDYATSSRSFTLNLR